MLTDSPDRHQTAALRCLWLILCSSALLTAVNGLGSLQWSASQLAQMPLVNQPDSLPHGSAAHHRRPPSHRQQHAWIAGDLIMGALYPMHYGNLFANATAERCSMVNPYEGIQAFEATLYTLKMLREERVLGDLTLGVLAMDTCQDVDYALSQSLNFTNVLVSSFIGQKMIRCSDGSDPSISGSLTELLKIIGVLGAAESDVSVAIASFMKHFRIPQV